MSEISTYPQEWLQKALGEVCQVEIGGTPSRNAPRFWADEGQEGYPWAAISDLGPKWIYETAERITQAGVNNSNVKLVPKGTVLMSFKLTLGRVGITGIHLYTNEAIAAFYPDSSQVFAGWLYHVLPKVAGTVSAEQAIKGQTLNKDKLQRLMVRLPPLSEQRQIAEILDAADEAIRQTERVIAKLKAVKAGLLHDLLTRGLDEHGHLRDPQAHPEQFKDSPLGRIPREWEVVTVESIAANKRHAIVDGPFGSNLKSEHYRGQGVPVIQSGYVTSGEFWAESYVYVDHSLFQAQIRSAVEPGDIVMAKIGAQCGTCALLPEEHPVSILASNSLKISTDYQACRPHYLLRVLHYFFDTGRMELVKTETAQPAISLKNLRALMIPLPSLAEQDVIVAALDAHDARIRAEEVELAKLRQVKRGLMDDLLTGRVRVV